MNEYGDLIPTSLCVRAVVADAELSIVVSSLACRVWRVLEAGMCGVMGAFPKGYTGLDEPVIVLVEMFQPSHGIGWAYLHVRHQGLPLVVQAGLVPHFVLLPMPEAPYPHGSFSAQRTGLIGLPHPVGEYFGSLAECWPLSRGAELPPGWSIDLDDIRLGVDHDLDRPLTLDSFGSLSPSEN